MRKTSHPPKQMERPLLMQGQMVRATLEDRKRQTRRTRGLTEINNDPDGWKFAGINAADPPGYIFHSTREPGETLVIPCPYGQPGDRLWCRESFVIDHYDFIPHGPMPKDRPDHILDEHIYYKATCDGIPEYEGPIPWRPSIHMPKWASRITLEITKIRVERLQEISEEDAVAEGVGHGFVMNGGWPDYQHIDKNGHCTLTQDSARMSYATLWDSINGVGAWDKNPWVWVIDFKTLGEPGAN